MFKTLLCIPPCYCYTFDYPPLGTPLLAGFLKERGFEVMQADYNLGYLDYLKKRIFVQQELPEISTLEASVITRSLLNSLFAVKRNKSFYYSDFLASDFIGSPYADNTNSSFHFAERLLSSPYLDRYVEDKEENTFLQFFLDEDILLEIEQHKINLVGISIIAPSQVIASFTLGYLIKRYLADVHVVIGGQWVSLYREELKKNSQWMRFFDSMIIFEGESALFDLVVNLSQKKDLSLVSNLIYHSDSQWLQTKKIPKEDLDKIACPDFDGLPLKAYTSFERMNGIVLTYQTARECYWNKCVYCVDLPLPKMGYRERSIDLIIRDLNRLKNKYNFSFLEISNATLSCQQMKELSQRLIQERLDFSWWCFCRPETAFTRDIFALAKKAGCQTVVFGLESASQRVLDFVRKGINFEAAKKVILDCYDCGIEVDLQIMLGLPSERLTDALDTIKFLVEHRDCISSVTFNSYYVTSACDVYLNPEQFGINYKQYPDLPFKFFHEFSHILGELSHRKTLELIELYNQLVSRRSVLKAAPQDKALNLNYNCEYKLSLTVGDETVSLLYHFDKDKNQGIISDSPLILASLHRREE